jgi:hypothetical protein
MNPGGAIRNSLSCGPDSPETEDFFGFAAVVMNQSGG